MTRNFASGAAITDRPWVARLLSSWSARGLWLCLLLLCCSARAQPGPAGLRLTFIDVGQGDATLIISPTGKRVLVDGGPPEGAQALLTSLRRQGVDSLDLVLLTHPHMDHLGGLVPLVRALPVRLFMDTGFPHPSPAYTALLRALAERGAQVRQAEAGRRVELGDGAVLTLLGPPRPWLGRTRSDVNANSAVGRLTWRRVAALLTGDAEPETEAHLLQSGAELSAGLLKVAHHGGRYSSTMPFLRAVRPEIAVISVARKNDYGHPSPETLARLQAAGARVYRTDLHGDVTVTSVDGERWTARAERAAAAPPAPPASAERPLAAETGPVVGSRRSDVFHRPGCPGAAQIRPENLVRFASRDEALARGRRPAADCQP